MGRAEIADFPMVLKEEGSQCILPAFGGLQSLSP